MKRASEVKQTPFFLVSQVLSFRLEKQTSKNVVETTFIVFKVIRQLTMALKNYIHSLRSYTSFSWLMYQLPVKYNTT